LNTYLNYRIRYIANHIWFIYLNKIVAIIMAVISCVLWKMKIYDLSVRICLASLRFHINSIALKILPFIFNEGRHILEKNISDGVDIKAASVRTIVLKWPTFTEEKIHKGIILIKFTKVFSFYLKNIDCEELEKYFYIVLEPSWSGYADPDILYWKYRVGKVVVEASEQQDRVLLSCFPESFVVASFGSGDWVQDEVFVPIDSEKIYDSVYVANNNPIKRVERYLIAVKKIVESGFSNYKGCLLCASWGGDEAIIDRLIKKYNLYKNVDTKFSLDVKSVARLLNSSKCNVLLSYKEGSNRSLFEAMFCNVPVICIYENVGVNKSYINEFTGLLMPDVHLEKSLVWMVDNYKNYSPRRWALENISPSITRKKLVNIINTKYNDILNDGDVFEKVNIPEAKYKINYQFDQSIINEKLLNVFLKNTISGMDIKNKLLNIKNEFDLIFSGNSREVK